MLWEYCLQQLEHEFPNDEDNTQLRSLYTVDKDDSLYLLAPNAIVLQNIHDKYMDRIEYYGRVYSGKDNFEVILQIGSRKHAAPKKAPPAQAPSNQSHLQQTALRPNPSTDYSTNIKDKPNVSERFVNALNAKMVFNNYVEGKSNQLAFAAALQVSEKPGESYNPLFIYGGVGLGKTHLMHAIGNRILEFQPDFKVIYVYAERFVNDMISAFRTSRIEEFKLHYRGADALLIDDVQFFANKDRSMEEIFHTFNSLHERKKQIILASDRIPRDLEGLDDRLKSRFASGLIVSVEPPDLETRVAILTRKAEESQLSIPSEVSFFIAKRFNSNIRELEGALQRVIASMRLLCVNEITIDFIEKVLKDQLAVMDKQVSISAIKKAVTQYFNIRIADLDSARRSRMIARPRQIAMALAKELTNHSLPEIGDDFGGRDHTTVLHAVRKVAELRQSDSRVDEDYRTLLRTLTN